ncbi:UNVERIFIED_CONTAM: hypothetical protein FKN15_035114 [Acipenser sinensis]
MGDRRRGDRAQTPVRRSSRLREISVMAEESPTVVLERLKLEPEEQTIDPDPAAALKTTQQVPGARTPSILQEPPPAEQPPDPPVCRVPSALKREASEAAERPSSNPQASSKPETRRPERTALERSSSRPAAALERSSSRPAAALERSSSRPGAVSEGLALAPEGFAETMFRSEALQLDSAPPERLPSAPGARQERQERAGLQTQVSDGAASSSCLFNNMGAHSVNV